MTNPIHIPVLLHESIEGLDLKEGDRVFEGTVGLGGHTEEIVKRIGQRGVYIGTDEDESALLHAEERLAPYIATKRFYRENFRNLDRVLDDAGYPEVDKILFDIGTSNLQLEASGRGFSWRRDDPLLMTFHSVPRKDALTAREIVNEWGEESIRDILKGYGEERFAYRIASAIIVAREKKPIETTGELAEIVTNAVPRFVRSGKIHPATKTFQAIRIAVNDELGALREGIAKGFARLVPGGRMAVISFHSLEDRIVKNFFKERKEEGYAVLITKRPIAPSEEERIRNPKSRSAKLRILEKTTQS